MLPSLLFVYYCHVNIKSREYFSIGEESVMDFRLCYYRKDNSLWLTLYTLGIMAISTGDQLS